MTNLHGPSTSVSVQMTYPRTNYETNVKARVQVMDDRSGHLIVEFDLTADQVVDMISSTHVSTTGAITPPDVRAQLGMQRVHKSERIPREALTGAAYGDETRAAAQGWASERMAELNGTQDGPGWERFSVTSHNYGLSATFVRWEVAK